MKKSTIQAKQQSKSSSKNDANSKQSKPPQKKPQKISVNKHEGYFQLLNLKHENDAMMRTLAMNNTNMKTLESKLNDDGKFPTQISDHAFAQVIKRLEDLTTKSTNAYDDIMNGDIKDSLFLPSNLRKFIYDNVKTAIKIESVKKKTSRSGGHEYIYDIKIPKWNDGTKECVFTLAVEQNNIKTCYFNLIG